ncbi:MAG: hypothetical protein WBP12_01385 [Candidatus Saccharimonas sp.]
MSKEAPIEVPKDLQEWASAEAPIEPSYDTRNSWRDTAEDDIALAFLKPTEDAIATGDEPALTAVQRRLYMVIAERPKSIEVDDDQVANTMAAVKMLGRDVHDKRLIAMMHWARRAIYALVNEPFIESNIAMKNFFDTMDEIPLEYQRAAWKAQIQNMRERIDEDDEWHDIFERATGLVAELPRDTRAVREMMAVTLVQIEHLHDVRAAGRIRKPVSRLAREPAPGIKEPNIDISKPDGSGNYTRDELVQLPLEEITHEQTGLMFDAMVAESDMSPRGKLLHDASRLWSAMPLIAELSSNDTQDTRNVLHRVGYSGDVRVAQARLMRGIVFMRGGVSFEAAASAHELFSQTHPYSGTKWHDYTKQLTKHMKLNDPELVRLVDDCMEFVEISGTDHDLCLRVAALAQAELTCWKQAAEFEQQLQATIADKQWVEALRTAIDCRDGGAALLEPRMRIKPTLSPTRYAHDTLEELPMDTIVDEEMAVYLADMRFARDTKKRADKQFQSEVTYRKHAKALAKKLIGKARKGDIQRVHHARYLAFSLADVNYNRNHWHVHHHSRQLDMSDDNLVAQSIQAVQKVYTRPEQSRLIDEFLRIVASDDEARRLMRHVICLTLDQIRAWDDERHSIDGEL